MQAPFEVVRNAFAVQVEHQYLITELCLGNGRENPRAVLCRDRFSRLGSSVHGRVAEPGHDEREGGRAVLHDGAAEVVDLERGLVGDRSADHHGMLIEDVRCHAQVVFAVREDVTLDRTASKRTDAGQLGGHVVVFADGEDGGHTAAPRASRISRVFRSNNPFSRPTG